MKTSIQTLIGDQNASDPSLYNVPITVEEAEQLAFVLLAALNVPAEVKVVYGRKTRKRFGTIRNDGANENNVQSFLMRLNILGLNVGTVLHELAHIAMDGDLLPGHPKQFRTNLENYTEMFKKLSPIVRMGGEDNGSPGDEHSRFPPAAEEGLTEAFSNMFIGKKIPVDVINSETGNVIIPANRRIMPHHLRNMAANAKNLEICPGPTRIKIMSLIDDFN